MAENTYPSNINLLKSSYNSSCHIIDDDPDDVVTSECSEQDLLFGKEYKYINRHQELDYDEKWGTYAVESDPWQDTKRPYVNVNSMNNIVLTEEEREGILSDRMIAAASSYLDRSPISQKYVLCKCDLSNQGLENVDALKYHHFLQYLNLSRNNITNLEVLSELPILMNLNTSYNIMGDVLDFKAPFNLTFVNYSHNCVNTISDLSSFWSIVHLDLSYNNIREITGLESLKFLQTLNLSYNEIVYIKNISTLCNLVTLNLCHNKINKFDSSIKFLTQLKYVNLNYNQLKSLRLFNAPTLHIRQIEITNNLISHVIELVNLDKLLYLTELDMRANPVAKDQNFWEVCINTLRSVKQLNRNFVDAEQKVQVSCKFNPIPQVTEARKLNMLSLLNNIKQNRFIYPCVLPADCPPPVIIVLVGPLSCNKNAIIQQFIEIDNTITVLLNTTTRPKVADEVDGKHYHYTTLKVFQKKIQTAEFLTVMESFGHFFGLHKNELIKRTTSPSDNVYITHCDLVSALILKDLGYMPMLILTLPKSESTHRLWLKKKYLYDYVQTYNHLLFTKKITRISPEITSDAANLLDNVVDDVTGDCVDLLFKGDDQAEVLSDYSEGRREMEERGVQFDEEIGISTEQARRSILKLEAMSCKEHDRNVSFGNVSYAKRYCNSISTTMATMGYSSNDTMCLSVLSNESNNHEPDVQDANVNNLDGIDYSEMDINKGSFEDKNRQQQQQSDTPRITQNHLYQEEVKTFLDSVIKERNLYVDFHRSQPGIFQDTIFTDEVADCMERLKNVVKVAKSTERYTHNLYDYLGREESQKMVARRVEVLQEDLYCSLGTSVCQRRDVDWYVKANMNNIKMNE